MASYQVSVIIFALFLIGSVVTQRNASESSPVDDWLKELIETIFNIFDGEETGE